MPLISGGGGSAGSIGFLGSAAITAAFSTASTTAVQVTGLTATVTVPTSVHVKVTVMGQNLENNTGNDFSNLTLWDGVVGSGTQVGGCTSQSNPASQPAPAIIVVVLTPGPGSKTYNVGLHAGIGGTAKLNAGATLPAVLLVEAI